MFRAALSSLLALAPTVARAQPAQAIDVPAVLRSIQGLARAGQPALALSRLRELLRSSGRSEQIRAYKGEILLLHENLSFLTQVRMPDLHALVDGDLRQFDAGSGRVVWRWTMAQRGDWSLAGERARPPLRFRGPHTLRFRGLSSAAAGQPVRIRLCLGQDRAIELAFRPSVWRGRITLHAISAASLHGDQRTELASLGECSCGDGNDLGLSIHVLPAEIRFASPRGEILRVAKDREHWGEVELVGLRFERFDVAGEVEPSWLQNRIDAERERQRIGFLRTYDAHAVLPPWLFDVPPRPESAAAAGSALHLHPDPLNDDQLRTVEDLEAMLARGAPGRALAELEAWAAAALPPATAHWLRAQATLARGEPEPALAELDAIASTVNEHDAVLGLRARILASLRRPADARECLLELQLRHPGDADVRMALAQLHLDARETTAAHALLAAARAEGVTSAELLAAERMLQLAITGPGWRRPTVQSSAHFELHSDLGPEICRAAIETLEEGLHLFRSQLPFGKPPRGGRFRVYLFSGEQGYLQHLRGMLGPGVAAHTHGVFVRSLGQILVWNLPTRAQMLQTIRHEGLHQYLGDAVVDPPRWLDEGLAEYFEQTTKSNGRWVTGAARADHLATLRGLDGLRLTELLTVDDARFFADAETGYAMAWGTVHLLLHSSKRNRELFDSLWQALIAGARGHAAVERFVLPEAARLQRELAIHLQALRD